MRSFTLIRTSGCCRTYSEVSARGKNRQAGRMLQQSIIATYCKQKHCTRQDVTNWYVYAASAYITKISMFLPTIPCTQERGYVVININSELLYHYYCSAGHHELQPGPGARRLRHQCRNPCAPGPCTFALARAHGPPRTRRRGRPRTGKLVQ